MRKIIQFGLVGLLTILFTFCNQKKEFSLIGKTKNLKDGEKLYIRVGQEIVDSTEVTNNTFEFNTQFEELPVQILLSTKKYESYTSLWVEDAEMTFDASQTSNFKKAIVTGSENERLAKELFKLTSKYSSGDPEEAHIKQDFVLQHPNVVYAANILSIYSSTWGKEKTKNLYKNLSDEVKNSSYGKNVKRYIDLAIEPKVGDQYADFKMKDMEGNEVSLSDYEGKMVLLEFWSSWCGGCRAENPNLVKTYEEYHSKGFEVLGVSLDEIKESWIQAVEKDKLPWTQVSDLSGPRNSEPAIKYGVTGMPDNFLIDQNGTIIARRIQGEELREKLNNYLTP